MMFDSHAINTSSAQLTLSKYYDQVFKCLPAVAQNDRMKENGSSLHRF